MKRVMKYKLRELLRSPLAVLAAALLLLMLNGAAIWRSGVLSSGGGGFNAELKYALIVNNYGNISSLYGVLAAIFLGAGVIGPDLATGNLFVLLTAYPARGRYYLACFFTVWGYLLFVQLLLLADVCVLLRVFSLPVRPGDFLAVFPAEILNSTVLFGLSAVGSIYCKGYRAAAVGVSGYSFASLYLYDRLPLLTGGVGFSLRSCRNVLCWLLPLQHAAFPSVTEESVLTFYALDPGPIGIVPLQILYAGALLAAGCLLFRRRQFS